MMDTFLEEWRNPDDGKPCSEDRKNKFIQTFNELIFFVGNKPVNLYTEQDIQLLFDYFAKTPKARKKYHARKSIQELLELKPTEEKLQTYENKVKHRQRLRQFFDWVVEQVEDSDEPLAKSLELVNPCDNIKIRKNGKATKRTYFTNLDEDELFNRKLYLKRSIKDGLPVVREDHQYWGSIILRTTGARPNELFQSELRNWEFDRTINTWVLCTSDRGDDQHIKNTGSIRPIPMPTIVMDKGFDEYIRQKKAEQAETSKLFSEVKPRGFYYSPAYTTWFNYVLMAEAKIDKRDQLGRRKSAYSLRHTFITRARKGVARFDVVKQYVGHSVKQELGVTSDYFGGYDVNEIFDQLDHLSFPVLNDVPNYDIWKANLMGYLIDDS
ncbi:hypothetical protein OE749_04145 [Aestuariibacter sp. AA17]|uniref:Tyr recombinase domain-containing protein n=1 Tax=Fluctibacter corallii TaxID=2984329 RepID=A0ABT3A5G9_9ALTE|nr:hypothetical protein [Aestuariibacter sp. AA17]MCV2883880.1 hypothetical protein [Aestuariibacter sp. AA17]